VSNPSFAVLQITKAAYSEEGSRSGQFGLVIGLKPERVKTVDSLVRKWLPNRTAWLRGVNPFTRAGPSDGPTPGLCHWSTSGKATDQKLPGDGPRWES
jgi:hypothetical protein